MDDKLDFIIKSIVSKREPGYKNEYHELIMGKPCTIGSVEPGWRARLLIEYGIQASVPVRHWFLTSVVESISGSQEDGYVIETKNSTYTLVPNKEEQTDGNA